jgi:HD superfamily phosphohydrolase
MPQWGLTDNQRRARPWGIPPDWLAAAKVNTDPIHGDIYLSRLEQAIVDSPPFQRLRRIRQLGMVHLVYPGATHTRFSHALGALRVVQDLLDIILNQRNGRHADADLFQQWEQRYRGMECGGRGAIAIKGSELRIAEAVVLARLGSLLHDICHVPYGHTLEDDLGILTPHDENKPRLQAFWKELGETGDPADYRPVQSILGKRLLKRALWIILLSKTDTEESADAKLRKMGKYPFVADLVTNTICADLLDYLPRDHNFTGLPVELGQRFMSAFYVVPTAEGKEKVHYPERMALRISNGGRERHDIISELLKHLRYRYELQERAIVHHAKLAADSMLGKALELWHDDLLLGAARQAGGAEVRAALNRGEGAAAVWEALSKDVDASVVKGARSKIERAIEDRVRTLGDDSLLELLAGELQSPENEPPIDRKVRGIASDLLNRRLYKRAAEARRTGAKTRLFELFGKRSEQRKLERAAAQFAGVPEEQVIIWLPDPEMRLKVAEVLVDFGHGVAQFDKHSEQAREIYRAHRDLWTATVFVHREVREKEREPVVLAKLAELMGVEWDRHQPRRAENPQEWPICLAASRVLGDDGLDREIEELLETGTAKAVAHRTDGDLTFDDLCDDILAPARRIRKRSAGKVAGA